VHLAFAKAPKRRKKLNEISSFFIALLLSTYFGGT
tara:strand:- start:173 stop:277 length:105 start_codon:yes stop_codon:yes gene_type:complete